MRRCALISQVTTNNCNLHEIANLASLYRRWSQRARRLRTADVELGRLGRRSFCFAGERSARVASSGRSSGALLGRRCEDEDGLETGREPVAELVSLGCSTLSLWQASSVGPTLPAKAHQRRALPAAPRSVDFDRTSEGLGAHGSRRQSLPRCRQNRHVLQRLEGLVATSPSQKKSSKSRTPSDMRSKRNRFQTGPRHGAPSRSRPLAEPLESRTPRRNTRVFSCFRRRTHA